MSPDHFVMLWSDMLRSTINEYEAHVKWVFVVALLLCDKEGDFRCTPESMARTAVIPLDQAIEALEKLSEPDPGSTSVAEEGRRLVSRGPNQWHVVNYTSYRRRMLEEKVRIKDRERKRDERGRSRTDSDSPDKLGRDGTVSDPVGVGVDVCDEEMGESEGEESPLPIHDAIRDQWNRLGIKPACTALSDQRKSTVAARQRQYGYVAVFDVVKKRAASDFLSNVFNDGRGAPFDWVMGPKNFVKVKDGNYDGGGTGPKRKKPGGYDLDVGAQEPPEISDERKAKELTLKHILQHAVALAMLEGDMTEDQRVILRDAAVRLGALAESDMARGFMEEKLFTIHDGMMDELLGSLPEEEEIQLQAALPAGGVKFETWARKELQARFGIPDPLEYALEEVDRSR